MRFRFKRKSIIDVSSKVYVDDNKSKFNNWKITLSNCKQLIIRLFLCVNVDGNTEEQLDYDFPIFHEHSSDDYGVSVLSEYTESREDGLSDSNSTFVEIPYSLVAFSGSSLNINLPSINDDESQDLGHQQSEYSYDDDNNIYPKRWTIERLKGNVMNSINDFVELESGSGIKLNSLQPYHRSDFHRLIRNTMNSRRKCIEASLKTSPTQNIKRNTSSRRRPKIIFLPLEREATLVANNHLRNDMYQKQSPKDVLQASLQPTLPDTETGDKYWSHESMTLGQNNTSSFDKSINCLQKPQQLCTGKQIMNQYEHFVPRSSKYHITPSLTSLSSTQFTRVQVQWNNGYINENYNSLSVIQRIALHVENQRNSSYFCVPKNVAEHRDASQFKRTGHAVLHNESNIQKVSRINRLEFLVNSHIRHPNNETKVGLRHNERQLSDQMEDEITTIASMVETSTNNYLKKSIIEEKIFTRVSCGNNLALQEKLGSLMDELKSGNTYL